MPRVNDALGTATVWYFKWHPDFRPGDNNEKRVRHLIKTHLADGQNTWELVDLILAMEDEPLYQKYLSTMREHCHIHREQLERTSSKAPPQPSRKRSRSRSTSREQPEQTSSEALPQPS